MQTGIKIINTDDKYILKTNNRITFKEIEYTVANGGAFYITKQKEILDIIDVDNYYPNLIRAYNLMS